MKYLYSILAGIFFSVLGVNAFQYFHASSSAVSFEDLPDQYLFLLFPKENTKFYDSEKLTSALGTVDKAVTATRQELTRNIVGVIYKERKFYSKSTDFNFYIDDPVARDKYLTLWKESLEIQGYSNGHWKSKAIERDNYFIELAMDDDKHARKELYRYLTDGHKVLNAYFLSTESGIANSGIAILSFFTGVLIFGAIWDRPRSV